MTEVHAGLKYLSTSFPSLLYSIGALSPTSSPDSATTRRHQHFIIPLPARQDDGIARDVLKKGKCCGMLTQALVFG